jgi:hypothetical protein
LDAEDALAEVARVRATTRGALISMTWQTSVLWGAIFLGAVLFWHAVSSPVLSMLYWLVAVPAGIAATWQFESRLPRLRAAGPFTPPFWVISAIMTIGAFGAWWVFDERLAALVWYSVLLGGFAAFAAVDRNYWEVAAIGWLWVWGAAIWLSTGSSRAELDLTLSLFTTAIGAGLIGIGFGQRIGRP